MHACTLCKRKPCMKHWLIFHIRNTIQFPLHRFWSSVANLLHIANARFYPMRRDFLADMLTRWNHTIKFSCDCSLIMWCACLFQPATTGASGAMEDDSTKKETSLPGWTRLRNEQLEWHPKVSLLLVPHSPAGRVQTRKGRWGQWKWETLPTPRVWERGEERNETSMRAEEKLLSNRKTALLKLISFAHTTCICLWFVCTHTTRPLFEFGANCC